MSSVSIPSNGSASSSGSGCGSGSGSGSSTTGSGSGSGSLTNGDRSVSAYGTYSQVTVATKSIG